MACSLNMRPYLRLFGRALPKTRARLVASALKRLV